MSKYIKLSDIEHVLARSGMYIGSIEPETSANYIFQDGKIVEKTIQYSPGLYKIFDEILVNALDHTIRTKDLPAKSRVSEIKVTITDTTITVWNNGLAIPVILNEQYNEYNPEVVFGNLRSSENFDDTTERRVGGMNGMGSTLTNIFSKSFIVDVGDSVNEKKFHQEFTNNMSERTKAKISSYSSKKESYTMITFTPDLERFGNTDKSFSKDTIALFTRRVYDIIACSRWLKFPPKVSLNGVNIKMNKFSDFSVLFVGDSNTEMVSISPNEHWDISVGMSQSGTFEQVSFVNGIYTKMGGKHVDAVTSLIVDAIQAKMSKTLKTESIKRSVIKNNLCVFIRSSIDRPTFSSQTKDELTTSRSKFGSTVELPMSFIDKVGKLGLYELVTASVQSADTSSLKKTDGKKKNHVHVVNYTSAEYSGTVKSNECTLILTEGLSAKTMVMSGLSATQRKHYGIYPLKGKAMNVRDTPMKKINENEEITSLKKIMGLEHNKVYTDTNSLRYGRLMIIADADVDGIHIKSLVFNIFSELWPSLFKMKNFLCAFQTPILRATQARSGKVETFYKQSEYEAWKKRIGSTSGWTIKYYKGLGTSTAKEAIEYFKQESQGTVLYLHNSNADEAFNMAFNKKRADDRKEWLSHYNKDSITEPNEHNQIPLDNFINADLIHFSNDDLSRSIPNIMDGLKTSQRKILYSAFKRNLTSEVKVAQFAGYVSEHSMYHHGEKSLEDAIVGMARTFVGTNNINLLMPNGQFGSRLQCFDNASSRYIFTELNPLTKSIFIDTDRPLLKYINDDGTIVEPEWYAPIIPMILVNGCRGIGTGFSTFVPCYKPTDIITSLKNNLLGKDSGTSSALQPWYQKFNGKITETSPGQYESHGVYTETDTTINITELPIGVWTEPYEEWLRTNHSEHFKSILSNNTDTIVNITMKKVNPTKIGHTLKLTNKFSTHNMHLFDENQRIRKFDTAEDIIHHFIDIRLPLYLKRKNHLIKEYTREQQIMNAKIEFIRAILNGNIDFKRMKNSQVVEYLTQRDYPLVEGNYNYLLHMYINSMTLDNIQKLQKAIDMLTTQLTNLEKMMPTEMWVQDLDKLRELL
jgi:DNA topoisomerase-2